ncbi:MAG TPA: hypothetical protein ENH07_10385 [Nitrospirae bacterium]|nr:hypothetical protein [Nitrospirota bacterium]
MPIEQKGSEQNSLKADTSKGEVGKETGKEGDFGGYKTAEALAEAHKNLQSRFDTQGNEVGTLRKQTDFLMNQAQQSIPQAPTPAKPETPARDLTAELAKVDAKIAELDPDDDGYSEALPKLIAKGRMLYGDMTQASVLAAAKEEFTQILDDRDVQSMTQQFHSENPSFDTPEMQIRIQDRVRSDPTGMTDAVVAFREIQLEDSLAELNQLKSDLSEKDRLLKLKAGTDSTGIVITEGDGQVTKPKNIPRTMGKDRDQGMRDVLNAMEA